MKYEKNLLPAFARAGCADGNLSEAGTPIRQAQGRLFSATLITAGGITKSKGKNQRANLRKPSAAI